MPHISRIRGHFPYIHYYSLVNNQGTVVYISNSIRTFGLDLVGLFVPIFLFSLDFPIVISDHKFLNGAFWPVVYFGIRSITTLAFTVFFASSVFKKVSAKHLLVAGNMCTIITTLTLYLTSQNPFLFFIPAIFSGLVNVLYWVPYKLYFTQKDSDKYGNYGKNVGLNEFFQGLVHAFAPLLGGISIMYLGFGVTFLVSTVIILLSLIPIVENLPDIKFNKIKTDSFYKYFYDKRYTKSGIAFMGIAMDDIIFTIFWSLSLMYFLENVIKVGLLNFVSVFLGSLSLLVAVKYVDSKQKNKLHTFGVSLTGIYNFLRIFISSSFGAYTLEILDRVNPFFIIPFETRTYEIAKISDSDVNFLLFREMALHLGFLIALFLSLLIMMFLNWKFVFFVAIVGSLLSYYISVAKERDFKG